MYIYCVVFLRFASCNPGWLCHRMQKLVPSLRVSGLHERLKKKTIKGHQNLANFYLWYPGNQLNLKIAKLCLKTQLHTLDLSLFFHIPVNLLDMWKVSTGHNTIFLPAIFFYIMQIYVDIFVILKLWFI